MKLPVKSIAGNVGRSTPLMVGIAVVSVLIILTGGTLGWYIVNRKPLSELPGLTVYPAPAYSYSVSNITRPMGVAFDETNNRLYVAQSGGTRAVRVFTSQGADLGSLKLPGTGSHSPTYLALDPKTLELYVSDRGTGAVYVFDSTGKYLRELKPTGVASWGPLAIAVGADQTVYVADTNATPQIVWALKGDGTVIAKLGADDGLSFSNGVAVQPDGSVVVSDSNHGRVLVYEKAGKLRGALARGEMDAPFGMPRGLAVGDNGILYVVDVTNQVVRMFGPDAAGLPIYTNSFGDMGNGDGLFLYPMAVTTDTHGHVFVSDRENNRVQVWTGR